MKTIVEDTRNQVGKHKILNDQLELLGCKVVRSKLFVGDYTLLDNQSVCIDTKKDILEICGNICGSQHERFKEECIRAKENGIKLVILVEELPPENDLDKWESPKNKKGKPLTQVKGSTLKKAMITMYQKYGVRFRFCKKQVSAKVILEELKVWQKEDVFIDQ